MQRQTTLCKIPLVKGTFSDSFFSSQGFSIVIQFWKGVFSLFWLYWTGARRLHQRSTLIKEKLHRVEQLGGFVRSDNWSLDFCTRLQTHFSIWIFWYSFFSSRCSFLWRRLGSIIRFQFRFFLWLLSGVVTDSENDTSNYQAACRVHNSWVTLVDC